MTWVNGRAVGNGFGDEARLYALPPKLLEAGDNVVVVNVHDFWGNGGLHGPAEQRALLLADGTRIPLTGWEYSVAPPGLWPPHAPWESLSGVNVLYNAMIAPLGKYGLRGVAWYQGEANAGLDDARSTRRCSRRGWRTGAGSSGASGAVAVPHRAAREFWSARRPRR